MLGGFEVIPGVQGTFCVVWDYKLNQSQLFTRQVL